MRHYLLLLQSFLELVRLLTIFVKFFWKKEFYYVCHYLSLFLQNNVRCSLHNSRAAEFLAAVETEVNVFFDGKIKVMHKKGYMDRQI